MKENILDVFNIWLDSRLDSVHTCLPGKIDTYYGHSKRKAKVKTLSKLRNSNGTLISIPAIDNVPVIFPGSKKFNMVWPLEKDDGCLILFSEAALGGFLSNSKEADPESNNRFSLTDAICIPGLWSFQNVPDAPENNTDFFLTYEGNTLQMKKSGTTSTTIINSLEVDS